MADNQTTAPVRASVLHEWVHIEGHGDYCRQCGSPKHDGKWPNSMICMAGAVRREWGILTDAIVT